jgi:hypothetical protein
MQEPTPLVFRRPLQLFMLGCLATIAVGCAASRPSISVHESALGNVFLEQVSDKSFHAAHPIKLPETTIADVLRGVHTKEKSGLVLLLGKATKSSNLNDIRTFSEDDIAYLTPHITTALMQATPNQRVGFHVYSTPGISQQPKGNQNRGTTSGYLFADGLSLHFTLTQYRYRPGEKTAFIQKDPRPLPNTDGLRDREVTFLPEAVVRSDMYDRSSWIGKSEDRSIAIDYQLLTKVLAAPPPRPASTAQQHPAASTAAAPSQSSPVQPSPAGKSDADIQAFKEELKALQRKVDEQSAELQRLKGDQSKKTPNP